MKQIPRPHAVPSKSERAVLLVGTVLGVGGDKMIAAVEKAGYNAHAKLDAQATDTQTAFQEKKTDEENPRIHNHRTKHNLMFTPQSISTLAGHRRSILPLALPSRSTSFPGTSFPDTSCPKIQQETRPQNPQRDTAQQP